MDRFQKLKNIIIGVFIIIIILIILLIIFLKKNVNDKNLVNDNFVNELTEKPLEKNDNGFVKVDDSNMFFTVLNILNNYIDVLKYEINEEDTIEENPYQIRSEYDRKNILFSMLDIGYKNDKNISSEDDVTIDYNIDSEATVIPIEMKVKYSSKIQIYALSVYIEDIQNKSLNEKMYIIKIDNSNLTFAVKPVENYKSIDEIYEEDEYISIKINDYNKYFLETMNQEALAKIYIQRIKYMIINYTEIFYEKYLEKEYRDGRFNTYENFEKYIEENKEYISNIKPTKYLVEDYDDYVELVISDQYENLYIFLEDSIMNFKLRFDTYTIVTDKFITEYEKADEQKRVQMNVDKFIQMINRQDYITSYNCISEGFKNNYFPSQEEFENYIKNNFFEYNKFEFKNIEKKGSNIYVCTVQLTDLTGQTSEMRDIDIIMQLNDGIDFEMSFGM